MTDFEKKDHLFQCSRFRTFKKWPFKKNSKCLPSAMAEAGWYCTTVDIKDPSAMCAFCFKELSGWEPTDDPWDEHVRHSGECPFVKLNKIEKDFTVSDLLNLLEARLLKTLEKEHKEKIDKLNKLKETIDEAIDNYNDDANDKRKD